MDKSIQARFIADVVPRLTRQWREGAWIGCVFRAVGESEKLHAHFIAAAWEPPEAGAAPLIARLPDATYLAPHEAERALIGLLESIPATAKLYLAGPQHLDPALVTQVVLSSDRHLSPGLKEALAAFVGAEQARNEHSIRQSYTDRDEAFEAFKAKLFGTPK